MKAPSEMTDVELLAEIRRLKNQESNCHKIMDWACDLIMAQQRDADKCTDERSALARELLERGA